MPPGMEWSTAFTAPHRRLHCARSTLSIIVAQRQPFAYRKDPSREDQRRAAVPTESTRARGSRTAWEFNCRLRPGRRRADSHLWIETRSNGCWRRRVRLSLRLHARRQAILRACDPRRSQGISERAFADGQDQVAAPIDGITGALGIALTSRLVRRALRRLTASGADWSHGCPPNRATSARDATRNGTPARSGQCGGDTDGRSKRQWPPALRRSRGAEGRTRCMMGRQGLYGALGAGMAAAIASRASKG